ncbi:hypothetical protein [Streptomyces sp. NPDC002851]
MADSGGAAADAGGGEPFDEDAAWAAIVAGYGEEPPDPPGARPFRSVEDLADLADLPDVKDLPDPDPDTGSGEGHDKGAGKRLRKGPDDGPSGNDTGTGAESGASGSDTASGTGSSGSGSGSGSGTDAGTASGSATGTGSESGKRPVGGSFVFAPGVGPGPRDYTPEEEDEGHFVPPEPPPLPEADVTAKFAWLAVIGGPVLLLLAVLLGWDMTWWLTTLGVGGFLGGFATLVARMRTDDEDDDDPGRGAVV